MQKYDKLIKDARSKLDILMEQIGTDNTNKNIDEDASFCRKCLKDFNKERYYGCWHWDIKCQVVMCKDCINKCEDCGDATYCDKCKDKCMETMRCGMVVCGGDGCADYHHKNCNCFRW